MAMKPPIINVMSEAARKASRGLLRDFGEVEQLQVSQKGPADYVTEADLRAEKIVQAELARARPDFGFLLEETGKVAGKDADQRWIVDPLDGTTNFLHGIPHFAISIAHESHGEIVAGDHTLFVGRIVATHMHADPDVRRLYEVHHFDLRGVTVNPPA